MPIQPHPVILLAGALEMAAIRLNFVANWIRNVSDGDAVRMYGKAAWDSLNEFREWQKKEAEEYRPSVWPYWHLLSRVLKQVSETGFVNMFLGTEIKAQLLKDQPLINPPFNEGPPTPEPTDPLLRHLRESLGRKPANDALFGLPVLPLDDPVVQFQGRDQPRESGFSAPPNLSAGVRVTVMIQAIANGATLQAFSKELPPNSTAKISIQARDENGDFIP